MQTHLEEFDAQDAAVIAISVDSPEKSRDIVKAYGLTFPVLSDVGARVTREYGVVHERGDPINDTDIARPATFLVDREGRVAWLDLTENWRVRPRPAELLERLSRIP